MNAKWIAAPLLCAISGCATLQIDRSSIPTEATYQALNAYDFAQTVMVARNPSSFHETAWPTRAVIGAHLSKSATLVYGALWGLGHYAVTGWLDREADATGSRGWDVARWAWRIGSLAQPAYNVVHNHELGLRPFGGAQGEDALPTCPPQGTVLVPGFRCRFRR